MRISGISSSSDIVAPAIRVAIAAAKRHDGAVNRPDTDSHRRDHKAEDHGLR